MILRLLRDASRAWSKDNASFLGGAVAYHALFSIAPLLLIAIAIAGLIFGEAASENGIVHALEEYIGHEAAMAIQHLVASMRQPRQSLWTSVVGGVILIITACNFFLQLQTGLCQVWVLPPMPTPHFLWGYLRDYLLAFLMVLLNAFFWLAVLLGGSFLGLAVEWLGDQLPAGPAVWRGLQLGINFCLMVMMLVMTWRFLSHGRIPYRKFWIGATVSVVLFMSGRYLFGLYLTYMGRHLVSVFGAASSLVIFLVFVYYSAQILFFGAAIVKVQFRGAPPA
ncbi:MAG TPA: YihY/virulence factor BrkB family protein [Gemmatales bacterium]|nr:YihY/virulence factor BrkB family protein [Gemmatales bacterium]